MRALIKNRMFMLLIGGQGISVFGERIYSIALMWFIIEQTGSALSLGMSVISMTLPAILMMPWAGVLADKNFKREILFFTDVASGVIMFSLAFFTMNGHASLLTINICLMLASTIKAFFSPVLVSTIPLIVEKDTLLKANAVFQFVQQISNILGPAIGGILIAFFPIPILFAFYGISLLIAALCSLFLKIPRVSEPDAQESYFTRFTEGIRYAFQTKRLLYFILVGGVIINFFLAPLHIFLVIITNEIMKVGSIGLGWMDSAISLGALLGSFIILRGMIKNQIRLAMIGLSLEGITLMLAGLLMNYIALLILLVLFGLGVCFASVGIRTAFQLIIDEDKMGRVMSFLSMLISISVPMGTYIGSVLVEQWSITMIFLSFGTIVLLSGLSLFIPFKDEFTKPNIEVTKEY